MKRPNILMIMTDDHAAHAMSCYHSKVNTTPYMDSIAENGIKFENCLCTNSICAPSRAVILTGKHSHLNGVRTLDDRFDASQQTFISLLHQNGYKTAMVGKWHLGEDKKNLPQDFDYWDIFPGQGNYFDPVFIDKNGRRQIKGYATDIVTDLSLNWLDSVLQDGEDDKPFCLLCYHKAPHRNWNPDEKHKDMYKDVELPMPDNFDDDFSNRSNAAKNAYMKITDHMNSLDFKINPPEGIREYGNSVIEDNRETLAEEGFLLPMPDSVEGYTLTQKDGTVLTFDSLDELKKWKYQTYMKDYLRCVASVDDNIGRMLEYLDEHHLTEDTIVMYTSDQGFFLGDHGWFDKRFMYEESLRMPLVMQYPRMIKPGSVSNQIVSNVDFAQTFLDFAGVKQPDDMQGVSFKDVLTGERSEDDPIREGLYYRYWMHMLNHNVPAHYGVRTQRYKLIYYYGKALDTPTLPQVKDTEPEWEFFDLEKDPKEMCNVYDRPEYQEVIEQHKQLLYKLKDEAKDQQ